MEEATNLVPGEMPNEIFQNISVKISNISEKLWGQSDSQSRDILLSIAHSFNSLTATPSYSFLTQDWYITIQEIDKLASDILTSNQNRPIENSVPIELLTAKCLILFRARIFVTPTQIESHELELLQYIQAPPQDLIGDDLTNWVTTEARIADLKYKSSTEETKRIEQEISSKVKSISAIEERLTQLSERTLHNISVKLDESSQTLSKAFQTLKVEKKGQLNLPLIAMAVCAGLVLLAVCIEVFLLFSMAGETDTPWYLMLGKSVSFLFVALILIYFFRVALNQYNAIRNEMLQLEMRESLCQFIPAYREFTKFDDCNVEDFARHIFSPLQATKETTPHPMDSMNSVLQLVNEAKKLGTPIEKKEKLL